MRQAGKRVIGAGLVWAGLLAVGAGAQPPVPAPAPLPPAVPGRVPAPVPGPDSRLTAPVPDPRLPAPAPAPADENLAAERARLQGQLLELLKRLEERQAGGFPGVRPGSVRPPAPPPLGTGGAPVDALRAATNYFRDRNVDAALGVLRQMDLQTLSREDRAFAQYLAACCLRKLNRRAEAATLYREVADAKDDEFLAECAVWQLSLMRSAAELEAQLEQLRARPKTP